MPYVQYLSTDGLKAIANHKFKSAGYSWMDNLINPWWEFSVRLLPMWLAPNLVTLTGTCALVVMYSVSAWHSPDMITPVPQWVHFFCTACVFFYNTMDAIDGKQARRTGASSPLGQLFDHGCDAIGTVLMSMTLATSMRLGPSWAMVVLLLVIQLPFFLAQWEEKHTHQFRTTVGLLDVTLGQYLIMALMILSGLVGPAFWVQPAPFLSGMRLNDVVVYAFGILPLGTCFDFFRCVWNKSDKPFTAFSEVVPLLVSSGSGMYFFLYEEAVAARHFRLTVFVIGFINVHLITVMIINSMARMDYTWLQPTVLQLPLALFNVNQGFVSFDVGLWLVFEGTVALYAHYVSHVINEISTHLGIRCLSITPKQAAAAASSRSATPASKPRAASTRSRRRTSASPKRR